MIVSSHQANYFPWLGYFDKWAKADLFLVNDVVQLVKRSPEVRNLILLPDGQTKYLSLSVDYSGYLEKTIIDMELVNTASVLQTHKDLIRSAYLKTPFFNEVWTFISPIFENEYSKLVDLQIASMVAISKALSIKTPFVRHSELHYDKLLANGKNEAIITKIKSIPNASIYLSGNGAKAYMDDQMFKEAGIDVVYQEFEHPIYKQFNSTEFVSNLSAIDLLFNVGIDEARNIFWDNVGRQSI